MWRVPPACELMIIARRGERYFIVRSANSNGNRAGVLKKDWKKPFSGTTIINRGGNLCSSVLGP
jgi:hypothetical protein